MKIGKLLMLASFCAVLVTQPFPLTRAHGKAYSSGSSDVTAGQSDATGAPIHGFDVLQSFSPTGLPLGDLIRLSANVFLGTTALGGANGRGSVFAVVAVTTSEWTLLDVHDFTGGADGAVPVGGLAIDRAARTAYGTTSGNASGPAALGSFYAVHFGADGPAFTTIHEFKPGEGAGPNASLALGGSPAGAVAPTLYGTTEHGGSAGEGTVFSLSPPMGPGGQWIYATLYSFSGGTDGRVPTGRLLLKSDGSLIGTTSQGGDLACPTSTTGCGTVFRLSPPKATGAAWSESVLHAFTGADGAFPTGGVTAGAGGRLYGNTQEGGAGGVGVLYVLAPSGKAGTAATETILHSFDTTDGEFPTTDLVFGNGNILFGTALLGGKTGNGDVYRFDLAAGGVSGNFTVVHDFTGGAGGANPFGGMAAAIGQGEISLFGTTQRGGRGKTPSGTVFRLTL